MLKYGKTCQDLTAVLHETSSELHFPYKNGEEYILQSLRIAWPHYFSSLNVVFVVGLLVALFLIVQTTYRRNDKQDGKCVTEAHAKLFLPALPLGVSGDAVGRGIGWLKLMFRLV